MKDPKEKAKEPPKLREYFNSDRFCDWLTGKPKKAAYVPKGRRAPKAINIIR